MAAAPPTTVEEVEEGTDTEEKEGEPEEVAPKKPARFAICQRTSVERAPPSSASTPTASSRTKNSTKNKN